MTATAMASRIFNTPRISYTFACILSNYCRWSLNVQGVSEIRVGELFSIVRIKIKDTRIATIASTEKLLQVRPVLRLALSKDFGDVRPYRLKLGFLFLFFFRNDTESTEYTYIPSADE